MQGVTGSSPVVSTKIKRTVLCRPFYFEEPLLKQLVPNGTILVCIPPSAVYCVIRRVRPTNSKIQLSRSCTVLFLFCGAAARTACSEWNDWYCHSLPLCDNRSAMLKLCFVLLVWQDTASGMHILACRQNPVSSPLQ